MYQIQWTKDEIPTLKNPPTKIFMNSFVPTTSFYLLAPPARNVMRESRCKAHV